MPSDARKYKIHLTNTVRPGQDVIPLRIPDGPSCVFRRLGDNPVLEHELTLTPQQATKIMGGFHVEEAGDGEPEEDDGGQDGEGGQDDEGDGSLLHTLDSMSRPDLLAEVDRLDLTVEGTGSDGYVTIEDLRSALRNHLTS